MDGSFALEWWFNVLVVSMVLLPLIMHFLQRKIVLTSDESYQIKVVPYLYSWSGLIFGFFVPLLRGDMKWTFIYFLSFALTLNLANIILGFFYNRIYIENLLKNGYEPENEESEILLQLKKIKVASSLDYTKAAVV